MNLSIEELEIIHNSLTFEIESLGIKDTPMFMFELVGKIVKELEKRDDS